MNYTQLLQVLAVCAVLMIPLGASLGMLIRAALGWIDRRLPPRYLKARTVRRRSLREGADAVR